MKSILVDKLVKDINELKVVDQPLPVPKSNQARVRVEAAGANFFDYLMCRGEYQTKPPLPFVPGTEFAGVVDVPASDGKSSFKAGDRVCGILPWGAFTQYLVVPAASLIKIPDSMTFDHAAGNLKKGESVLIHAAAGGVGLAAVQIAKALGASVIIGTVGSDDKADVVRAAGATHVLNYSTEKEWSQRVLEITNKRGVDVVYDPVGGSVFAESTKCIAWLGRLLVVGFASGKIPTLAANRILLKHISVIGVYFGSYLKHQPKAVPAIFQALFKMHAAGQLKSFVCAQYALDETPKALTSLAQRRTFGKVIIHPQRLSQSSASSTPVSPKSKL